MIGIILGILIVHFLADFICQSRKMGLNKGKSVKWLTIHVAVYTLLSWVGWIIILGLSGIFGHAQPFIWDVVIATFVTHWITDYITSKGSGYAYLKMLEYKDKDTESEHEWQYIFWGVIGLDQLIHAITLLLTYNYLIQTI
jgi:hypothetical protein